MKVRKNVIIIFSIMAGMVMLILIVGFALDAIRVIDGALQLAATIVGAGAFAMRELIRADSSTERRAKRPQRAVSERNGREAGEPTRKRRARADDAPSAD